MRLLAVAALTLVLASCGPTATLLTDPVFEAASPEVAEAWASLRPWRDARSARLAEGWAGLPPGTPVLVGAALTPAGRDQLAQAHPGHLLVFLGPGPVPSGSGGLAAEPAAVAAAQAAGRPWRLRTQGLAQSLWEVVSEGPGADRFLALETLSERR